jgi:hypothetical protein
MGCVHGKQASYQQETLHKTASKDVQPPADTKKAVEPRYEETPRTNGGMKSNNCGECEANCVLSLLCLIVM